MAQHESPGEVEEKYQTLEAKPSGKPRVLIIDDEPANIKALEMIMAGRYDVCSAMRGKEGIELAAKEPKPDLIMLDIQMPGMDGYDVIKRLKQNPETRDIPVIFNSILSDEGTEQNVLDLGAVDYIRKPYHHVVTLARIRTHLRLKSALTTLTDRNAKLEHLLNLRDGVDRLAKHDLKLPIGAIISATEELLEREDIGLAARLPIKTIMSQSYHALDMVNRSMDLWKIEQGAYQYIPAEVDIIKVLRRAAMELDSLRKEKDIDIQILYAGAPAVPRQELIAMGEEWLFHSMMANLVKNALEAAPRGTRISLSAQEKGGLRIEVHNLGAVPVEVRGNFFEKHSSFGKKHGAGLGAYIAMKIAQTLGLMIHMDTSEESGTTLALFEDESI
ncbi:MAG: hybrid sensor histidine kinase/response regulator [Nitrospinota bacterium]|nr:hybrid sensor histidine kinase/response regulator [Nitrospinota bacterium]